jgi:hypothetical protein
MTRDATSRAADPSMSWQKRVLVALFGGLLALALAEIGARLALGPRTAEQAQDLAREHQQAREQLARPPGAARTGMFQSHPFFGYTLKPNFDGRSTWGGWRMTTDRNGFRNAFEFQDAPADTRWIGLFGGSAAFGWGIDGNADTLAVKLEAELHRRGVPPNVRVVNLALPAWHYPMQFIAFARLVGELEGFVGFEGWNELFVPLSNAFDYDANLPSDFPWSPFYTSFLTPGEAGETFETYARLHTLERYDPRGLLARSALYNWWRHAENESAKRVAAARLKTRPDVDLFPGARKFADTREGYFEAVDFGIGEYVKYARLLDGVASTYDVPALHVLQPFRYAERALKVKIDDAPNFARVLFREEHPGEVFARLRARAAEAYRDLSADGLAQFVDLAELIPNGSGGWIDVIHPSVAGVERIAARLAEELLTRGFVSRITR